MGRKYYIIAGEASGDMHGANLVSAMRKIEPDIQIRGFGGEKMNEVGVKISRGLDKLSIVGFAEVLKSIKTIKENFVIAKNEILEFAPDALILLDYPGFNLRMAKWAKKQGIKVFYYIAPQVWAWGKSRIKKMRRYIDKLFVILPFEEQFFKNAGIETEFVGHPLLEEISRFKMEDDFLVKNNIPAHKKLIAFLPGSRESEIRKNIKPVLSVIKQHKDYFFIVAAKSELPENVFDVFENINNVKVIYNQPYKVLNVCDAGIIKSGTSTLEAGLFELPQVVIYKVSFLSFLIAKLLVKIKFASLVNLILGKEVIKELLQYNFNSNNLNTELARLFDNNNRKYILTNYQSLSNSLKKEKFASHIVAKKILGQD